MTNSTIALTELAAKGADVDFIKQTLEFALHKLMDMEVEALCRAAYAGITQQLYIDGVLIAKATGAMLSYSWNIRKVAAGTHTLMAVAKDRAGNTSSTSVKVTK